MTQLGLFMSLQNFQSDAVRVDAVRDLPDDILPVRRKIASPTQSAKVLHTYIIHTVPNSLRIEKERWMPYRFLCLKDISKLLVCRYLYHTV